MGNVPRLWFGLSMLVGVVACGGKTGDVVRPEDFKGGDVLGASPLACGTSPSAARPFTVDLDSATRGDLEADMNEGVVVVAYDCKGLRVLSNCGVSGGSYDYGGFTPQDEVLQITGLDDLAVNLPLGAAKLGAEIKAGRSIDLALVTVGRRSTTVGRVGLPDLEGECTGATHYVQKASLGAFSIATGSVGKVAAIASYFSIGASASSTSERSAGRRAGSLEECLKALPTDLEPPVQCRLPLRLELTPVAADEETASAPTADETIGRKPIEAQPNPCPEGFELSGGLCTQAPGAAYLCDPKDEAECREQCDKGSAESCTNLGAWIIDHNDGSPEGWELAKQTAMPIFKQACDGGHVEGCAGYARVLFPDEITRKTLAITKQSLAIGKQACTDGSAVACQDVALAYHNGSDDEKTMPTDFDQYREYSERACKLGNHYSCGDAAEEYVNPLGSNAKDPARALALFDKGCDGGEAAVCSGLAHRLLKGGGGVKKDIPRGVAAATNACRNDADECYIVVDWVKAAGEAKVAFEMLERGCTPGNRFLEDSCSRLGDALAKGIGTKKDLARAKEAWSMACEGWKVSTPTQAARTSACLNLE
jgi:TPR repeat protein